MKHHYLRAILIAVGMVGLMTSGATFAQDELFVANFGSNSISVFSKKAGINAAPLRIISGPATKLSRPMGVAVDTVNNEIVVANQGDNVTPESASITVYARDGNGNVAPLRTIAGNASGFDTQRSSPGGGLAVDPVHNEIFVPTDVGYIGVWSRTADGNAAPLRTIGDGQLDWLGGVVLDMINDELIVAQGEAVLFFARSASGDEPPKRTIRGDLADINTPQGVALDTTNNEIVVADYYNYAVKVFARNASGNVAPLRTIASDATSTSSPVGVAIDSVYNELFVSYPFGVIAVYARTANGYVAPLRTITAPATGLDNNLYIALDVPLVTTHAYMQRVYVAYYGRPADPAGQNYWASRMDIAGHSLEPIIAEFGNSDEFNRRYGGLGYPALVTKIYQQALARGPDVAGLNYYVAELQAGRRTLQSITLDVLNGASTAPDNTVVANKLDVAAYYTRKVTLGCLYGTELDGVTIVAGVTADLATIAAAKAAINSRCGF